MWVGAGDDLRLGWEVVIGLPAGGRHFRVIVDAHDGQILYSHELTAGVAARGDVFSRMQERIGNSETFRCP